MSTTSSVTGSTNTTALDPVVQKALEGITIKKNLKMKYPNNTTGKIYQGSFIFGLDIVNESGTENTEDDF
jgi:hypothetical protein